jgi:hypothetical protein
LGNIGLKEQKFLGKLAENGFFSLKFGILGEIRLYLAFWANLAFVLIWVQFVFSLRGWLC